MPVAIPTKGVLFGARVVINGKYPESDLSGFYLREKQLGRKITVPNMFRNFEDTYEAEQELIQGGRIPQISWPIRGSYPGHAAIISGACDSSLRDTAAKWKALGGQFLLRAFWEVNGKSSGYGDDPADFIKAWVHIWSVVKPIATNTNWMVNFMTRPSYDHRWTEFLPPLANFSWITTDAYDHNPMNQYLAQCIHSGDFSGPNQNDDFYSIMTSQYPGKHVGISEGGQRELTDPTNEKTATLSKPDYWNHVVGDLKANPKVKLFCPWDVSSVGGDWRFDTTEQSGIYDINGATFQAVKKAVNDPYMNPVPA